MKKFKEVKTTINFDIFPYKIYVILSNDVCKARQKYRKLLGDFDHPEANAIHSTNGDGRSYIFFNFDVRPGVVAHEVFHAIWELLDFIGASHNNELMAYLSTYIIDKIYTFIKKSKKKA